MVKNIKTNKKYLLLIPLVVSLIMLTFFSAAYDEIIREKHDQKFNTVQNSLNFIVSVVDRVVEADDDWNTDDYAAILMPVFSNIDQTSAVHVVLRRDHCVFYILYERPPAADGVYHSGAGRLGWAADY